MNYKKVSFVLMTISFVMIISGAVSSFVFSLKSDQVQTRARMTSVSDEYESFSTITTKFEEAREELYQNVFNNTFFDTMAQTDASVKTKLSNYEAILDELGKLASRLKTLCQDMYYPESNINHKCSNYASIYEQAVNYFVGDIKLYNSHIKEHNNYQASHGGVKLENYQTNKKYLDYNHDKEYEGKEDKK